MFSTHLKEIKTMTLITSSNDTKGILNKKLEAVDVMEIHHDIEITTPQLDIDADMFTIAIRRRRNRIRRKPCNRTEN